MNELSKKKKKNTPNKGLKQIIRGRILFLLLAGALLLVVLFSTSQFLINLNEFRERQFELTRSLQHSIMWQIMNADETIRFLVESCNDRNKSIESQLHSAYEMHSYFKRLMVISGDGNLLYAEPDSLSLSDYSALIQGGYTSSELFSDTSLPYVDPQSGSVTVDFLQQSEKGNYIVGQLDLLFLQGIITKALEGGNGTRKLIITDSYGNILAHPDFTNVEHQVNIGGSRLISDLQSQSDVLYGYYSIMDKSFYTVATRFPQIDWFLIDATMLDSLLFELGQTIATIAGLFLLFILVWSIFVGNVVNRTVVIPLNQFIDAIERSSISETPEPVQQQISVYTEFIELQEAFNAMALKIKKRERDLKKYKKAVQQAGFAIYITDKDGTIEYVNPAFERTTGYTPNEAIGRRPSIFSSGEMENEYYEKLWTKILSGEVWEEEIVNRRKNGEAYYGHQTIAPIFNDKGEIVNFIALQSDITDSKKAAQKIKESETLYKSLFQLAADAIMVIEPRSGKLVQFNEIAYRNLGYTAEEFKDMRVQDFEAVETEEETEQHIEELMKTGYGSFESIHKTKQGQSRNVIVTVSLISFDDRPHLLSITHDITELKRIENQLRQAKNEAEAANQAKSDFIANVSHEIRTPMNAVLGYNQLLYSIVSDPQAQSYISAIEKSSNVLLDLINDILDLSKIEAGRLSLEYGETNIRDIIQDIEQIFKLQIEQKGLEIRRNIEPSVPELVFLDESRLRQIMLNLLGNAVKFTDQGKVEISIDSAPVEHNDDEVNLHFMVSDTGIGIESSQLERIFEAFRQQEGQSTRKYGGTGLGLSITKRLIEAMGGKIEVTSQLREGSTFYVNFFNVKIVQRHSQIQREASRVYNDNEGASVELQELDASMLLKGVVTPDRFIEGIENEFYPRWQEISKTMFLDEVQAFAVDLQTYAESYSAEHFARYGRRIWTAAQEFQIDTLDYLMAGFQELVQKMKTALS